MSRFIVTMILCAFATTACASAEQAGDDESTDATEDEIKGSPTEERARQAAARAERFDAEVLTAYEAAPISAFTPLADSKELKGEASTDFGTMTRTCTKGYKVSAQRWTAKLRANADSNLPPVQRKLYTIDAYNTQAKAAIFVGIYDEKGTLLLAQQMISTALVTSDAASYRKQIAICEPVWPIRR